MQGIKNLCHSTTLGKRPPLDRAAASSSGSQDAIAELLRQQIGFEASSVGPGLLARIVSQTMQANGFTDLRDYYQHLLSSRAALTELIEAVVVPETSFFRHAESFTYLRRYVQSNPSRRSPWRILSLPCSTGEEPYSIAMTLLEAGLSPMDFQIHGADVSMAAIAQAQAGSYGQFSFRKTATYSPEYHIRRYFQRHDDGYLLSPEVRSQVHFYQANLTAPRCLAGQAPYDIIFCRNVLIYFHPDASQQAQKTLHRLLAPGGLVFFGYAEMAQIDPALFTPIAAPQAFAYRRVDPAPIALPTQPLQATPTHRPDLRPPAALSKALDLGKIRAMADGGDLAGALVQCDRYLTINPTASTAYVLRGEIRQAQGQDAQAKRDFQKALYLAPRCEAALVHLLLICEQAQDKPGAQRLRQRLQRLAHTPPN